MGGPEQLTGDHHSEVFSPGATVSMGEPASLAVANQRSGRAAVSVREIGPEDAFAFPELLPGSIVRVNPQDIYQPPPIPSIAAVLSCC